MKILKNATKSALGVKYNAPGVFDAIVLALIATRGTGLVATQADVVAHSMGGLVVRTLETFPDFTKRDSFGAAKVHKLITIGTPHLGTPLATRMLDSGNTCTRMFLAEHSKISFRIASLEGANYWSGGLGDLQGDGQGDGSGGDKSDAIQAIQQSIGHDVPTALIAATMDDVNLDGLTCTSFCGASKIRDACPNDWLAQRLTKPGWPTVFGQASDGIVPLSSQVNNNMGAATIPGIVHSSGLVGRFNLSFNGPSEQDPLDARNTIQRSVIQFLNAPTSSSSFHKLP